MMGYRSRADEWFLYYLVRGWKLVVIVFYRSRSRHDINIIKTKNQSCTNHRWVGPRNSFIIKTR